MSSPFQYGRNSSSTVDPTRSSSFYYNAPIWSGLKWRNSEGTRELSNFMNEDSDFHNFWFGSMAGISYEKQEENVCKGGTKYDINSFATPAKVLYTIIFFLSMALIYYAGKLEERRRKRKEDEVIIEEKKSGQRPDILWDQQVLVDTDNINVINGTSNKDLKLKQKSEPKYLNIKTERLHHLDFGRILCIACVVTEHAGSVEYSLRNVYGTLQWVLQFLYLISGWSSTLSRNPLHLYIGRLFLILILGVGLNLIADIIRDRDWEADPGDTVFQMTFVVMLILMAILQRPITLLLQEYHKKSEKIEMEFGINRIKLNHKNGSQNHGSDHSPDNSLPKHTDTLPKHTDTLPKHTDSLSDPFYKKKTLIYTGVYMVISFLAFLLYLFEIGDSDEEKAKKKAGHLNSGDEKTDAIGIGRSIFLLEFFSYNLFVVYGIHTQSLGSGLTTFVLLAQLWLSRLILPYDEAGFLHMCKFYIFGMTCSKFNGLASDRSKIISNVKTYWPLSFVLLLFLQVPNLYGRCDRFPPKFFVDRARFYAGEMIFLVWFCSGAFNTQDPLNLTPRLTKWALLTYVSHEAVNRIVPAPYTFLFFIGMIPGCFVIPRMYSWLKDGCKKPIWHRVYGGYDQPNKPATSSMSSKVADLNKTSNVEEGNNEIDHVNDSVEKNDTSPALSQNNQTTNSGPSSRSNDVPVKSDGIAIDVR